MKLCNLSSPENVLLLFVRHKFAVMNMDHESGFLTPERDEYRPFNYMQELR
jgi:hypothetical protein